MMSTYEKLTSKVTHVHNIWDKRTTPTSSVHDRCGQMIDNVLYIHKRPSTDAVSVPKSALKTSVWFIKVKTQIMMNLTLILRIIMN